MSVHTPGPWCVVAQPDGAFSVEVGPIELVLAQRPPWPHRAEESIGNGFLIALATTAPHSCSVPGCPGPENKRKLEAFEWLLEALRALLAETAETSRLRAVGLDTSRLTMTNMQAALAIAKAERK